MPIEIPEAGGVVEAEVFKVVGDFGGLFLAVLLVDIGHDLLQALLGHGFVLEREIFGENLVE